MKIKAIADRIFVRLEPEAEKTSGRRRAMHLAGISPKICRMGNLHKSAGGLPTHAAVTL